MGLFIESIRLIIDSGNIFSSDWMKDINVFYYL